MYKQRGEESVVIMPCEKCGRGLTSLQTQKEHNKGCGEVKCETCGKIFSEVKHLKQHAVIHTMKFARDICGKPQVSNSKL